MKKDFTILVYNSSGLEIGYWFGTNSIVPNDSIASGNPINWGTKEDCIKEIEAAKSFAKKQGWEVKFGLEIYG
jgi:hypothetical protein